MHKRELIFMRPEDLHLSQSAAQEVFTCQLQ